MAARKSPKGRSRSSGSKPDDPVTAYAKAVVARKIVAGPHVRDAAARHLKDLKDGPKRGLVWDVPAAERAIRFFPVVLRLNGGQFEGVPFELHVSQQFIVGSIFGWKRTDGTRRFRRAFVEEGKGNGKSPLAAGIGLYGLIADEEPRAEVYAFATKKDQAMVLFRDAVAMVRQSDPLKARLQLSGGAGREWNIADLRSSSFFRPIANDDGQSGPRPHIAIGDEVHEHRDGQMIEMLERGFKFRRQPLLFMITNSGFDRKTVCWEEHLHAIRVAAGDVEDDTTFSFVCGLDDDDDPLNDPGCWAKANPLLGTILKEDYLADVVAQAKAIPGKLNNILRLHFCVWTDADTAWVSREQWEKIEDPGMSIDAFAETPFWAGLDIGTSLDMTAKALVFPDGLDGEGRPKFAAFVHGYLPAEGLEEHARKDRAPYDVWVRNGFITATPGKTTRLDYVARDLVEEVQAFGCESVAYDVWLIKRFNEELEELGVDLPVVEHPQGWNRRRDSPLSMPDSINALEQLIFEGRIRVHVNPALRSAVMSARLLASAAGLRRFDKNKATARIDMAVALAMAVGTATAAEQGGSIDDFLSDPVMVI